MAAENEYGDVAAQIGGTYVDVTSVMSNPTVDPHTFEVSPQLAQTISSAQIVIQNGLGYDGFMNTIESAVGGHGRVVIEVRKLLGRPQSTPNPHLWYDPATMPAVARELASDLSAIDPAHASYFTANAASFAASVASWTQALAAVPHVPVATTEPVADYLLEAAGVSNLTPFRFQADIMNGVDPTPQDVSFVDGLLSSHRVKALVYNVQVVDSVTEGFVTEAKRAGIPIVGVYETMPVPGYHFVSWMLAETHALQEAVTAGVSAPTL